MEGSGLQWSFSSNKPGGGSSQILSFRSSQDNGHGQQQTLYPLALSQQRKSPAVENARAAAGYKTNNSNKLHHQQYNNNSKMNNLQQSRELKKCSSMPGLQRFSSSSTPPPPHHIVNLPTHGHSFLKQQHPSAITRASNYKASAIVGSTDLSDDFSTSSSRRGPSQMTIFYNGLVCVYDDVSPEKAQAIMLLAGNGKPTTPPPRSPTQQVIDLTTRIPTTTTPTHSFPGKGSAPPMSSSVLIPTSVCRSTTSSSGVQQQQQQVVKRSSSQLNITPDCIVLNSSPNPLLSVQSTIPTSSSSKTSTSTIISSQLVKQPDHQPSSMVVRPLASFATANSPVPGASRAVVVESTDPPPPSATANGNNGGQLNFQQSAGLPQARNASLQRFLEKRKERVLSVAPYTTTNSKKGNNSDKSENVKGDHHQPTVRRAISQPETTMTPR